MSWLDWTSFKFLSDICGHLQIWLKVEITTFDIRHLPGKSAHLQTVTGHFSNTDLRDVVDICCRYGLQLTQN